MRLTLSSVSFPLVNIVLPVGEEYLQFLEIFINSSKKKLQDTYDFTLFSLYRIEFTSIITWGGEITKAKQQIERKILSVYRKLKN